MFYSSALKYNIQEYRGGVLYSLCIHLRSTKKCKTKQKHSFASYSDA